MQFQATLALCVAVLAAVAEGRIAFTTLPSSVKAGSPVKLAWEGADGTPITITLKRGPSNNLQTVALVTGNASGNSYTWTPSSDLENGSDYALQITQDETDINYTGLFTISGGSSSSGSSSSSSSSASSSASASASPIVSANSTTAAPSGTAPVSAGVTGASASRNTTLSSATLSKSASSATSSAEASTTSGEGSGSGSSSTATGSSSSATPTNAAVNIASNFGLLLAGVAAVVYLG